MLSANLDQIISTAEKKITTVHKLLKASRIKSLYLLTPPDPQISTYKSVVKTEDKPDPANALIKSLGRTQCDACKIIGHVKDNCHLRGLKFFSS